MKEDSIKIFTAANCSFCTWAKRLLDKKQVGYREIRVDQDDDLRRQMVEKTKRTSVPQIFIGVHHVGGYQEMVELDQDGKLDEMLSALNG